MPATGDSAFLRKFTGPRPRHCVKRTGKILMIVDVHSHAWDYPGDFTETYLQQVRNARAGVEVDLAVRYEDYRATATADTKTIVFGGKAKLSGTWVDDRYVANYVAAHPDTLIGFLSVDPTQEGWEREMEFG